MADNCVALTFLGIDGGSFRFGDVAQDETDGVKHLKSSSDQVTNKWIRGPYDRFLIFNGSDFEQRDLNDTLRSHSDNKLNINFYQKGGSSIKGRLVTLYVQRNLTYYAVVCNAEGRVAAEQISKEDLDGPIDSCHRALFEMVEHGSTNMFKFKSIQGNRYLGFNESSNDVLGLVDDPENQYMSFELENDGVCGNV